VALQDSVVLRTSDLLTWLVDESEWDWGYMTPSCPGFKRPSSMISSNFVSDKWLQKDMITQPEDSGKKLNMYIVLLAPIMMFGFPGS